ncbi:MAG: efflux RND transporter permease subunit, partial [bacterium]
STALEWALGPRAQVVAAALALFVCTLAIVPGIGREFFPQVDAGQVVMRVRAPSNLRLDATEARIGEVEEFIATGGVDHACAIFAVANGQVGAFACEDELAAVDAAWAADD